MTGKTKQRQPWTAESWVSRESGDGFMVDAATGPIAFVFGVARTANGGITGVAGKEGAANGILIAAAPAMAKALAAVVHRYDTRTTDDMCRRPGERKDPPDVAACRAALDLCGWQWGKP